MEPDGGAPGGRARRNEPPRKAESGISGRLAGAAAAVKDVFANIDADRMHDLMEAYRNAYGGPAWEALLTAAPRWRIDTGTMTGFESERILELLPKVLTGPERHEIAAAVWAEHWPGVHETVDLGELPKLEPIERITEERTMALIRDAVPDNVHELLFWAAGGDAAAADRMKARVLIEENGRIRRAAHRAAAAARLDRRKDDEQDRAGHRAYRLDGVEPNHVKVVVHTPGRVLITVQRPVEPKALPAPEAPEPETERTETSGDPRHGGKDGPWWRKMLDRLAGKSRTA